MEKTCDLCLELRPVVYCKADSAHLCLSCDAKVHSANSIVDRHPRTLLCDSCKYRSADIQCMDHRMFMCRVCDLSLHRKSSHGHQKRTMISSYTGCPSAKDFAAFWGFKLNDTRTSSVVNLEITGAESDGVGSSSQRFYKISHGHGGQSQKGSTRNSFLLDQILDLKRLQLIEGNPICGQDEQNHKKSSSVHVHNDSKKSKDKLDHHHFQRETTVVNETRSSTLGSSPFPSPRTTVGFPSYTESFWQGRIPMQSGQLWSQNIQDLGVCEELAYNHADSNTPDIDSIFQNFEESFGTDQDVPHSHKGHAKPKKV